MKKLNRGTLTVLITLFALQLIGCGGGGGGSKSVQDQLTNRMKSLSNALKSGNTDSVMANFSQSYYSGGTDYWEYRALIASFFAGGGRSWLENLQGMEFIQADDTHAARRFTATHVIKTSGSTDRIDLDSWESFRLEDGKWLIFGSQRSSRGVESEQKPSLGALLGTQIEKAPPNAPTHINRS